MKFCGGGNHTLQSKCQPLSMTSSRCCTADGFFMFNAWHHVKTLFLTLKFVVNGSFLLHVILLFFLDFFCVFSFIGDYKVRNLCENDC